MLGVGPSTKRMSLMRVSFFSSELHTLGSRVTVAQHRVGSDLESLSSIQAMDALVKYADASEVSRTGALHQAVRQNQLSVVASQAVARTAASELKAGTPATTFFVLRNAQTVEDAVFAMAAEKEAEFKQAVDSAAASVWVTLAVLIWCVQVC